MKKEIDDFKRFKNGLKIVMFYYFFWALFFLALGIYTLIKYT